MCDGEVSDYCFCVDEEYVFFEEKNAVGHD